MPYDRDIHFQSPLVAWHELALLGTVPQWSPEYWVDSPRLLLPRNQCVECEFGARRVMCDSVNALWLTPAQAYRMRQPFAGQRSTVLIFGAQVPAARAMRAPLPPDAHLRLALLRASRLDALAIEEQLLSLAQVALVPDPPAGAHRAVERAREYLATHAHQADTLAEIAMAAHCSPYHLARQFRRHTGFSLHGYRERLRLDQALQRLQQGESCLSTLAADLGYSSHSHFTASVRRRFGHTPRQLRTLMTAPAAH